LLDDRKRIGYPNDIDPPHSSLMSMIGSSLLWVGWFASTPVRTSRQPEDCARICEHHGRDGGCDARLMFTNGRSRASPRCLAWSRAGRGPRAVTPASGFAGPMGSIVLGLVAGSVASSFCAYVKRLSATMRLDVFGVHCIGGIIGAIGTGILVRPTSAASASRLHDQTWLCLARD